MRTFSPVQLDVSCLLDDLDSLEASSIPLNALERDFDTAMRQYGVVYLTGTGIPGSLMERLREASSKFFAESISKKLQFNFSDWYGEEGYMGVGKETVISSHSPETKVRDMVESLVIKSAQSNRYPSSLHDAVERYMEHMHRLLRLLIVLMSRALGLGAVTKLFDKANTVLKIANYPVNSSTSGYSAHTDFSGFTLLSQDASEAFPVQGALQIRSDDGWVTITPVKDALLVNAGDLITHLSNGLYKSPVHRVVLAENRTSPRLSIVFFTAPADEEVIEPFACCCSKDNPARFGRIIAGDWLHEKLRLTNG